jgi:hypothetical protein
VIRNRQSCQGEPPRPPPPPDTEPAISNEQREALYHYALAQMAEIADVHGTIAEAKVSAPPDVRREVREDSRLLSALVLPPAVGDAVLGGSKALRGSLERLRASATAELTGGGNYGDGKRAKLAITACDALLGGDAL